MSKKTYLYDGVYAADDGEHIVLTAERQRGTSIIYLDGRTISLLFEFIEKSRGKKITVRDVKSEGVSA